MLQVALAAAGRRRIRRLNVLIGEACPARPDDLARRLGDLATGTAAAGAQVDVTVEPLSARCASCGAAMPVTALAPACPVCGGRDHAVTGGDRVALLSVDLDG